MTLSPRFDLFVKNEPRKLLFDSLRRFNQLPSEERSTLLQQAWEYSKMNSDGQFKSRAALKYAQLNSSLSFVEISKVQESHYSLLVGDR